MLSIVSKLIGPLARLFPKSNAVTEGPSPKVTVPGVILAVLGGALVLVDVILKPGVAGLVETGLALLGASGVVGLAGGAAPPGSVVVGDPVVGLPSDAGLPAEAVQRLNAPAEDLAPPPA